MKALTDEEYDALDEYHTKNPPVPGPNGTGAYTRMRNAARSVVLDDVSLEWLKTRAREADKTPAEIISDMVQKEIARQPVGDAR